MPSEKHNVDAVQQFCEETGFRLRQVDEHTFVGSWRGKIGICPIFVHVNESTIVTRSICPVSVPDEQMNSALEYVNMVNWKVSIGNLEVDTSDGEVSCRTSLLTAGERPSNRLVGAVILSNLHIFDYFIAGLLSVILLQVSPDEAIRDLVKPDGSSEHDDENLRELLSDVDVDPVDSAGDD